MQRAHPNTPNAPLPLRPDQVPALAAVAFAEAGLRFDEGKLGFLQARLSQSVLDSGSGSFRAYIDLLDRNAAERQRFVEALTVHTTSFFRDKGQYEWMHSFALPALTLHRTNIVLWSAACSSGQEGWTSLMVTEAYRRESGKSFTYHLIGTDISTAVLDQASQGVYCQQDIDTVAENYRLAYFLQARKRDGRYRISSTLRQNAEWRHGNLITGDGMAGIAADIAFLRNVLIYFDAKTKAKVIEKVIQKIRPGGYLLTGHSDTGLKHPDLTAVQPSIFQKVC